MFRGYIGAGVIVNGQAVTFLPPHAENRTSNDKNLLVNKPPGATSFIRTIRPLSRGSFLSSPPSRSRHGIGPSTRRHLAFCSLLSVARGPIIGQNRNLLKTHKSLYNKRDGIFETHRLIFHKLPGGTTFWPTPQAGLRQASSTVFAEQTISSLQVESLRGRENLPS